jgi:FkbM family methyltransferase
VNARMIRHRLTPRWLQTDQRRRRRYILLRKLGLARCFEPPALIREPELRVRSALRYVVADHLLHDKNFTFLQIGAYDGVGDDDLRELIIEHRLRGVLLEPQPAAFAGLQATYHDQPQLTLLQAAIAEEVGTRELFTQRGEVSMAASFDRNHLRKHGVADDEIDSMPVACHTVESALAAAGLATVDLIQIDAEGYDYPIIRAIDFTRIRPSILRFEYRHMSDQQSDDCLALLAGHGYQFLVEERDIIACRSACFTQPSAAA